MAGDWFDDNAPQQMVKGSDGTARQFGNASVNNRRGTYTSSDIAALIKQLTGRDARPEEASQWGDDIDQQYYQKIYQTIASGPEAVAYRQQQQNPTTPPTNGGDEWASKDYSDPNNIRSFFQSKGITDPAQLDRLVNTWSGYYQQFGSSDPSYFYSRMTDENDLTGSNSRGGYGDLLAPFTEQFSYDDFKAPTMDDLKNSPGFQASLDRASNTLQRSAAAKGSLLSGSTLQSLSDQTADLTSQGYSNLFNQDAQTYATNRGNAYDAYKERRANFYQNQDSPFAKLLALSSLQEQDTNAQRQLNLGYAGLANQQLSGGSNQYNSLLTGGANAQAAGIMGQNNAYQGLYGNVSQIPSWLALLLRGQGGYGGGFNQPNAGNS